MTTNIVDFADYQNRTAIQNFSDGTDDSLDQQLSSALLAMYDKGLVTVTYDENGELMFEANKEATEEQWEAARDEHLAAVEAI
jgi:hypothetical protein